MIGILTAIVGDLAGIFGCLVGLKDSVTGTKICKMVRGAVKGCTYLRTKIKGWRYNPSTLTTKRSTRQSQTG